MFKFKNKKSQAFTLVELLIVIGILAILASIVILIINPAELLAETRDSGRITELNQINKALLFFQSFDSSGASLGDHTKVYVSLPSNQANCSDLGLPALTGGYAYACSSAATYRNVDGTGWIPVNFASVKAQAGSLFTALPIDPVNTVANGYYYTYIPGSWALSATMESEKYIAINAATDGGTSLSRYETGNNTSLNQNLGIDPVGEQESVCGNNVKEGTEVCDGIAFGGETCASIRGSGYTGSLICNNCTSIDASACVAPVGQTCGNNTREGTEVCDGTDLNSQTCASQLGAGYTGTLSCNGGCDAFVTSSCVAPLSSSKAITAFSFSSPSATGVITEGSHTIAVSVPYGTNVTALVASFTTTGSSVTVNSNPQTSGVTANNFTSPVTYRVTAADSSTQDYVVTVTVLNIQATPTFSPNSGAIALGVTPITITSAGADTIYYTTNGSTPTTGSNTIASGGTITLSSVANPIKAYAVKSGYTDSAIGTSGTYTQAAATAPSSIVLAVGTVNPVGGVTNVQIPAAGATDTTGAVTGWVTSTANKIKFTVTDGGSAVSTITINSVSYTSGNNYTIAAASPLTIIVTTTEEGKVTGVRTFAVSVAASGGLIGYWNFNEGSGTTAADSSGNNNTASFNGAPSWVTGKSGTAVSFDGTDDFLSIPYASSLNLNMPGFTVAAWISWPSVPIGSTAGGNIVSKSGSFNLGTRIHPVYGNDGFFVMGATNAVGDEYSVGVDETITPRATITNANTWYHVALTYDNGTIKLYVNGSFFRTANVPAGNMGNSASQGLMIGGISPVWPLYRHNIDEVRMYSKALSPTEISNLYNL